MYLDEAEANNRIEKIVEDIKNGFKAIPVTSKVILEYSAYGKLASLKRNDGYSALYLDNEKSNEEIILQIAFYIPQGKAEFEVI